MMGPVLSAAEAAIYESLVVTRYMRAFGEPAVAMLIRHSPAIIAQLGCRTGYPIQRIVERLPGCSMTGVDNSAPALELARTKASLLSGVNAEYVLSEGYPTPLMEGAYTHSFGLHPFGYRGEYGPIFQEHQRVLTQGGQMVVALPLRGSFPEFYDMLREYALRHDQPHFGEAVDAAMARRPNPETLSEAIEAAGFSHVDVGVELVAISFENGRDFLEDPISRLVVAPDVMASLPVDNGVDHAWHYATAAIGKYWSEIPFELTVNIGSVSARKL
ncbi:MAG: methyltransferase domain-containing protein [Myxococcales bacterium]|nr:methyltransferase domain-containing protein [Myxococcales bacterium]